MNDEEPQNERKNVERIVDRYGCELDLTAQTAESKDNQTANKIGVNGKFHSKSCKHSLAYSETTKRLHAGFGEVVQNSFHHVPSEQPEVELACGTTKQYRYVLSGEKDCEAGYDTTSVLPSKQQKFSLCHRCQHHVSKEEKGKYFDYETGTFQQHGSGVCHNNASIFVSNVIDHRYVDTCPARMSIADVYRDQQLMTKDFKCSTPGLMMTKATEGTSQVLPNPGTSASLYAYNQFFDPAIERNLETDVPQRQPSSLNTCEESDKPRRYVTELKLELKKGRAHQVTQQYMPRFSDSDSQSDDKNEALEVELPPVKAILCRAAPGIRIQNDVIKPCPASVFTIGEECKEKGSSNQQFNSKRTPPAISSNSLLSNDENRETIEQGILLCSASEQPLIPVKQTIHPSAIPSQICTFSQALHVARPTESNRITFSSEQFGKAPTSELGMKGQKQLSPATCSAGTIAANAEHNFSPDTTLPPVSVTATRGLPATFRYSEQNVRVKDTAPPNFQSVLNRGSFDFRYDDTSGLSVCTYLHSSMAEEPSIRTFGDCVSSATVISPKIGKTSRGTQSDRMSQVKEFRDMQIQTSQLFHCQLSEEVSNTELRINGVDLCRSRLQQAESYSVQSKPGEVYKFGTVHEEGTTSFATGSPSTFMVLTQLPINMNVGNLGRKDSTTLNKVAVGAGDLSHGDASQIACRYWDETSCSRTIYQVIRENVSRKLSHDFPRPVDWANSGSEYPCGDNVKEASRSRVLRKSTEPDHGDQHEMHKYKCCTLAPSSTPRVRITENVTESDILALKPVDVGKLKHTANSMTPIEDVVLVDGGSPLTATPLSHQMNTRHIGNLNSTYHSNGIYSIQTGKLSRCKQIIHDEYQENTHYCSCCDGIDCGCYTSESSDESQTLSCECCRKSPNFIQFKGNQPVGKCLRIQRTDIGEGINDMFPKSEGVPGHICDIVYEQTCTTCSAQAKEEKTCLGRASKECTSDCSCCSCSSASRSTTKSAGQLFTSVNEHAELESCNKAVDQNKSIARENGTHVGRKCLLARYTPPLSEKSLGVTQKAPLPCLTANTCGSPPHVTENFVAGVELPHKASPAGLLEVNSMARLQEVDRLSDKHFIETIEGIRTNRREQAYEGCTKERETPLNKKTPHLDALFTLVGEREKRNILQRWLLEQVAYSTKRKQAASTLDRCETSAAGNLGMKEKVSDISNCACSEVDSKDDCSCSLCRQSVENKIHMRTASNSSSGVRESLNGTLSLEESCEGNPPKVLRKSLLKRAAIQESKSNVVHEKTLGKSVDTSSYYEKLIDVNLSAEQHKRSNSDEPRHSMDVLTSVPAGALHTHRRMSHSVIKGRPTEQHPISRKNEELKPEVEIAHKFGGDSRLATMPPRWRSKYDVLQSNGNVHLNQSIEPKSGTLRYNKSKHSNPTPSTGSTTVVKPGLTMKNTRPPWSNTFSKVSTQIQATTPRAASRDRSASKERGAQKSCGLMSTSGVVSNASNRFVVCRYFELHQYDDLIKSYMNVADRRIKVIGLKNGCEIKISGPVTPNEHTTRGVASRRQVSYQCQISAQNEDKIWKCVSFLKEAFPNTHLRSSCKV